MCKSLVTLLKKHIVDQYYFFYTLSDVTVISRRSFVEQTRGNLVYQLRELNRSTWCRERLKNSNEKRSKIAKDTPVTAERARHCGWKRKRGQMKSADWIEVSRIIYHSAKFFLGWNAINPFVSFLCNRKNIHSRNGEKQGRENYIIRSKHIYKICSGK